MKLKIENIRTIIVSRTKRMLVLIKLKDIAKEIYITPEQIFQNTKIDVFQLELLIGSYIRLKFYAVGEKMYSGSFCEKENFIVKEYFITLKNTLDELNELNKSYLRNYRKIVDIWTFKKLDKTYVGVQLADSVNYYFVLSWLIKYTGIEGGQVKSLIDSWMNPALYKVGEKMSNGVICNSNTVLRELNIRFKIDFDSENFETNTGFSEKFPNDPIITYGDYLDLFKIGEYIDSGWENDWDDIPFSDPT